MVIGDRKMVESIFLSVIIFILILLGVVEILHCRSQKVSGWEESYYSRRLRRRLLGLSLLIVIVLSIYFSDNIRLFFHGPFWNLAYLFSCLALVLVVFLLLIKDLMDTARYAIRKQSDIAAQSIKRIQESLNEQKLRKDEEDTV
jgi:uncharacterized membrane protein